jgi:hypothetical protein
VFVVPAQQAAGKNQPHFQGDITVTMKKGLVGRTLGALLALALGSCFNYSYTWARDSDPTPVSQQEQIGAIKRILGSVSIRRVGESRPQPVKENDPVFLQDILRTDRAGKAWWRSGRKGSPQQGDASLGNSSSLEFVRFDQEGSSSDFSGEVAQGMVRFIRDLPKSTPRSHFIISTPTAIIEVLSTDRPADFVVEVSNDQKLTTVYGIWGAVKVRQLFAEYVQERIVRSCQRVDVEEDKEPQPVISVSPETLTELIRKTTIPKTLPEEVPSCRDSTVVEPPVIDEEPPYVFGPPVIDEEPPDDVRCPCPPGQELVGGACEGCPRWKKYSRRTCSCVSRCRHDKQCRRCETCRNGYCEPIHKKCPPGQKWDRKTCACVGECRPIHCQEGFWFNPQTCRCERKQPCDKKCPPGQTLDEKTCTCVGCRPIDCQEGFWFNPKTCRCERKQPCDKKCPPGQTLDEKTCTCVGCRPIDCQEGFWFNPKTCRCERKQPCDKKCPPGQHLDVAACKCVGDTTVPTKGCSSDSECGPRSVCRHGKCVPKEGHVDIPSKPERERPVERVHPSRPEREQPVERFHPSKPEREQPAERVQPYQRKDQRQ